MAEDGSVNSITPENRRGQCADCSLSDCQPQRFSSCPPALSKASILPCIRWLTLVWEARRQAWSSWYRKGKPRHEACPQGAPSGAGAPLHPEVPEASAAPAAGRCWDREELSLPGGAASLGWGLPSRATALAERGTQGPQSAGEERKGGPARRLGGQDDPEPQAAGSQ